MTTDTPRRKRPTKTAKADVEKIGLATAHLHRLLKELGHTRSLEKSASTMPDARERLSFIDKSMHEASEKTISAVETTIPLTGATRAICSDLSNRLADAAFRENTALIEEAISRLGEIAAAEEAIYRSLLHILEAQEFRDVAGQMVNKIVGAAVEVESILLDILKEYAPDTRDSLIGSEGLTAGPSHKPGGNTAGQDDVDDLLSSLGF